MSFIAKNAKQAKGRLINAALWIFTSSLFLITKLQEIAVLRHRGLRIDTVHYFFAVIWLVSLCGWIVSAYLNWPRIRADEKIS